MLIALLFYLVVGLILAKIACPISFPFGRNSISVTLLWPWPVAAHLVRLVTGKYPKWTPPL